MEDALRINDFTFKHVKGKNHRWGGGGGGGLQANFCEALQPKTSCGLYMLVYLPDFLRH